MCEDILRFGPLVGVCTESFESFNAVFRNCSILSNHRAPSRDIALQLADQEGLKHRLSGGLWQKKDGTWTAAGRGVRVMLARHPIIQRLIGWNQPEVVDAGEPKFVLCIAQILNVTTLGDAKPKPLARGTKTRTTLLLADTTAKDAINYGTYSTSMQTSWIPAQSVISQAKDRCATGAWVFFTSPIDVCISLEIPHNSELTYIFRVWRLLLGASRRF